MTSAVSPIPLRPLCREPVPVSGSLRSSQYNPMGRVRWDRALSSALFCRLNQEASYTRVVLSRLRVAACVVPAPGLAGASHRNSCFACPPTHENEICVNEANIQGWQPYSICTLNEVLQCCVREYCLARSRRTSL